MQLYYRKFGAGAPIIILHGLFGSSDNWLGIAKKLAGRLEVFLVDLRNHGRSPHSENHSYELMRDDLLAFMGNTGLEKAVLMGHSMGGKAAMCFATHYPDRVDKLIVVDIAPKSYRDLYRQEALSHADILNVMNNIDFSSVSSRRDVDRALSDTITNERIRGFLMKNLRQDKDKRYYWRLNVKVLLRELDNIMDGVNENCFNPEQPPGRFPVLFIRGEYSPYIADGDMQVIKNIFPAAKLKTISGAGHWLHAEQPGTFIKTVTEFAVD